MPIQHNFQPKASSRMRTLLRTSNKDTESSSTSMAEYSELDNNNGHSQPSANGKEKQAVTVNGKANGKLQQTSLSVLDKVSGMFKISKPNLSLPKPFLPSFAPKPPKQAPHVDAQLQVDLMESERWIQMLQAEVQMLREQLDLQVQDHRDLQEDMRRATKLKEHQAAILEEQHELEEEHFQHQRHALETTQQQLDLANHNLTALETSYQAKLAAQSQEFAQQRDLLQHQIVNLQAQLASITSDFEMVNRTLSHQTTEWKQAGQDAKKETESLQQQIVQLEACLNKANSTNEELQVSLTSSHAALESLQHDWQALNAKERQRIIEEEQQVAALTTQNKDTQLALETAEKLLQQTLGEQKELAQETKQAWSEERTEFESQVKALQLQLANEKLTKEKVLSQYKSGQTKQREQLRLLEENQTAIELLQSELAETKAQYETNLESMTVQKTKEVQALTERIQTEHTRQEQELKEENTKLKEELAKMQQLYEHSEQKRQEETKALETKLTKQQETAQVDSSQRELELQSQLEMATAEHDSKVKSLEEKVDQLRIENESLTSSLAEIAKSRDESIQQAMVLQTKYHDLRTDQEKWEERVSIMKREFQHVLETNKELTAQLVAATLEKEEFLLKAQTLEAQLQTALPPAPSAMPHQTTQRIMRRRRRASNFEWAIDTHSPNNVDPI